MAAQSIDEVLEQIAPLLAGYVDEAEQGELMKLLIVSSLESLQQWGNYRLLNSDKTEVVQDLSANEKLFISKYIEIVQRSEGITQEGIGGMHQSFSVSFDGISEIKKWAGQLIPQCKTLINADKRLKFVSMADSRWK